MKRTIFVGALCAALAAPPLGGVTAAPTDKTVIEDPAGDANGLNDQGTGDGSNGDHVTPADASTRRVVQVRIIWHCAQRFHPDRLMRGAFAIHGEVDR